MNSTESPISPKIQFSKPSQTGPGAATGAVRGTNPAERSPMNRSYEVMYILRPDLEDADVDKSVETFSGYVTGGGGTVKQVEKMGRRRLAYTVNKFNDGIYILLIVDAPASLISEVERRLRVTEQVIKFLTVRTDEEEKRVNKIKAHRAAHVKRSALPQENPEVAADLSAAADTSAPAESATPAPGTPEPQEVTAVPAAAEEGEPQPAAQA